MKQKTKFDAGVTTPNKGQLEINDQNAQGGRSQYDDVPHSSYAIRETIPLSITNHIVEDARPRRRLGTFPNG